MEIQHFASLNDAIRILFGDDIKITATSRVSGGDINDAYRLVLSDGTNLFMKENSGKQGSFFQAEADGLNVIAETGTIRTPRIFCMGDGNGRQEHSFLLMEFIDGTSRITTFWETFARELAAMHRADTAHLVSGGNYGFVQDNYIGERTQQNTAHEKWIPFFRDCRLEPQFHSASRYFGPLERKKINKLLDHLEEYLIEPEQPSLLHGDLWSGNFIVGNDGKAWLIDPAVYVGCAEADLAMTELFGGFSHTFYEAYREAAQVGPGYEERRDLYNLYHLLNHLNMFGYSYLHSVQRIVDKYTSGQ